ncbi:MAG TPA: MoxR family ATPase [Acidimicrobiales bacterium]
MESPRPDASPASFAEVFGAITDNIGLVLQGKPEVIEMALVCMVAEGHLLVEDVPGVGKTSLAKALAASIDCRWSRVQFTPDLLPSDVVGVTIWNRGTNEFEFRPGAVFANIVLGDEINRASPKTQSALLEAMEERQVTVDGVTYPLEPPFMVVATQNPVEHEGTYPRPESQLDRFLLRLSVGYPSPHAELEILQTHGGTSPVGDLGPVATVKDVAAMATAAREVHVARPLRGYLVELANASRRHPALAIGMSPRATLALQRTSRARAIARGRDYVVPDDIKALAGPVLGHRLVRTPEATMHGLTADDIVEEILSEVPVPTARANEG